MVTRKDTNSGKGENEQEVNMDTATFIASKDLGASHLSKTTGSPIHSNKGNRRECTEATSIQRKDPDAGPLNKCLEATSHGIISTEDTSIQRKGPNAGHLDKYTEAINPVKLSNRDPATIQMGTQSRSGNSRLAQDTLPEPLKMSNNWKNAKNYRKDSQIIDTKVIGINGKTYEYLKLKPNEKARLLGIKDQGYWGPGRRQVPIYLTEFSDKRLYWMTLEELTDYEGGRTMAYNWNEAIHSNRWERD